VFVPSPRRQCCCTSPGHGATRLTLGTCFRPSLVLRLPVAAAGRGVGVAQHVGEVLHHQDSQVPHQPAAGSSTVCERLHSLHDCLLCALLGCRRGCGSLCARAPVPPRLRCHCCGRTGARSGTRRSRTAWKSVAASTRQVLVDRGLLWLSGVVQSGASAVVQGGTAAFSQQSHSWPAAARWRVSIAVAAPKASVRDERSSMDLRST